METLRRGRLYWETLRHLRPRQVMWRFVHEGRLRFYRRVGSSIAAWFPVDRAARIPIASTGAPERDQLGAWQPMLADWKRGRVKYLDIEGPCDDWQARDKPKLWRYERHYHRELVALALAAVAEPSAALRDELTRDAIAMVDGWQRACPPPVGDAWEAYPVARRLLNWSIAAVACPRVGAVLAPLMAQHVRFLRTHMEHHLSGNHVLCDLAALVASAATVAAEGSDEIGTDAMSALAIELPTQLLEDGGYAERTVQYHAIVLQDVLIALCLARLRGRPIPASLKDNASAMVGWLERMRRSDGSFPWLNDAAPDATPPWNEIRALAAELGLTTADADGALRRVLGGPAPSAPPGQPVAASRPHGTTGWAIVRDGSDELLLDVGSLGPDEQPGHGHSDTLAYEVSWRGRPLVVDTGVTTYEVGAIRDYERSTRAHATITVNGLGPDEVWAAFRVGRRGRVLESEIRKEVDWWRLQASLKSPSGWRHERTLFYRPNVFLVVCDRVDGAPSGAELRSWVPLGPEWLVEPFTLRSSSGILRIVVPRGRQLPSESGWVGDGFGRRMPRTVLAMQFDGALCHYAFVSDAAVIVAEGGYYVVRVGANTFELPIP